MTEKLTLCPKDSDYDWWIERFVPNPMLWWWDDAEIPSESFAQRVIDRKDGRSDSLVGDIAYVNSFHTWAIHDDVERIIIDDGRWIQSLSHDERLAVSEIQVRLNRGLCILSERFGDDLELPAKNLSNGRVVLDQVLWKSLPDSIKRQVIEAELADFDSDATYPVPDGTPQHIAKIANGFVQQEGVNCLAVTAFAITANRDDLLQWMMPDRFEYFLRKYEYTGVSAAALESGDILVFRDDDQNMVHAAYAIQADRILNKNGQTSFNPVSITDLVTLEEEWRGYSLTIYRQESTGTRGQGDGPATTT